MTTATCVHHWMFETPSGAQSTGTCRKCGETRAFDNVLVDFGPGESPRHMVPDKAHLEMQADMRAAMSLVFAGHSKPRVTGRVGF